MSFRVFGGSAVVVLLRDKESVDAKACLESFGIVADIEDAPKLVDGDDTPRDEEPPKVEILVFVNGPAFEAVVSERKNPVVGFVPTSFEPEVGISVSLEVVSVALLTTGVIGSLGKEGATDFVGDGGLAKASGVDFMGDAGLSNMGGVAFVGDGGLEMKEDSDVSNPPKAVAMPKPSKEVDWLVVTLVVMGFSFGRRDFAGSDVEAPCALSISSMGTSIAFSMPENDSPFLIASTLRQWYAPIIPSLLRNRNMGTGGIDVSSMSGFREGIVSEAE